MNRYFAIGLGLIAIIGLSSKGLILYNEEILVLLAFTGFIIFVVQNYGQDVADNLDERSSAIQQELQTYLDLKEAYLEALVQEHKKQVGLAAAVKTVGSFANSQLGVIGQQRKDELGSRVNLQVNQQLNSLASMGSGLEYQLQSKMANSLRSAVLATLQQAKRDNKPINSLLVKKAIARLGSL